MGTHFLKKVLFGSAVVLIMSSAPELKGQESKPAAASGSEYLQLTKQQLFKFCGEYLPTGPDPRMKPMTVLMYKDVLYRHVQHDYVALNPVSDHKFIYDDNSGRSLDFVKDKDGNITEVIVARTDGEFRLKRNPSSHPEDRTTPVLEISESITGLMSAYELLGQFNGTALVSKNGTIVYRRSTGMANKESNVPNEIDTKFRLASVSKQFTALLIMQLVEKAKLDLHKPISAYLPDYPKEQANKITIHHLLTHSSGIPNYTSFKEYETRIMRNPHTPEDLVKLFCYLPLEFEPGKRFSYSNSGYTLLGYIIEKVTGKTYEQCVKEMIFTPLKMNNSGYDHSETIIAKRAKGYERLGGAYVNAGYIDMSVPFAAGGLYSTVEDLYLWDQSFYKDLLVSQKSKELIFKNYFEGAQANYGYGWGVTNVTSLKNKKTITITEHSGGINGFNSFISRVPLDGHCIILLSNVNGTPLDEISYAIRALLYDKPYDVPKRSVAYALADEIRKKGITEGLRQYRSFMESGSYKLVEEEINSVGYDFLNDAKFEEAVQVFRINVEAFPYSGNCYDSLGEAYAKQGNKKLAIENYKKSIELDPNNENGKKILAELMK